jgi:hypothetical protein
MQTECSADLFDFARVEGRAVVAAFDGGKITSDAGALLLGATDRAIGLVERFAGCFSDRRAPELVEHGVATLVGQRVFGIALGYEDLIDHDELRHDPTMAVLAGKLSARRRNCAPLAGKSTLNRLELGGAEPTRYHRIAWDGAQIEGLFVDLFVEAHRHPPEQIVLDPRFREGRLSMRPMIRCTVIRRGASFTAITTATAICRSTSFAAGICWPPSCGAPTLTPLPGRSRKPRALSPRSAPTGRRSASCCAPIRGLPARL